MTVQELSKRFDDDFQKLAGINSCIKVFADSVANSGSEEAIKHLPNALDAVSNELDELTGEFENFDDELKDIKQPEIASKL